MDDDDAVGGEKEAEAEVKVEDEGVEDEGVEDEGVEDEGVEVEGRRPPEECHRSLSSPKGPSNMKCSIRPRGTGSAVKARYVFCN